MKLPPETPRSDVSENELTLRKLDRRDIHWRAFGLAILFGLMLFNVVAVFRIQHVINQNQQGAIQARKTNFQLQQQNQAYIKCIILIRYDNVGLTQDSPRADVEKALDRCASNTAAN